MYEVELSPDKTVVIYSGGMTVILKQESPNLRGTPKEVGAVGLRFTPQEVANLVALICDFHDEMKASRN